MTSGTQKLRRLSIGFRQSSWPAIPDPALDSGARFRAAASIRVSGSGFGDDHRRLDDLEQVLEAIGQAIDL